MSGIVHTPEFDWMYKAEPDASVGGRADVWPAGSASAAAAPSTA
jgi:hypothetical protein